MRIRSGLVEMPRNFISFIRKYSYRLKIGYLYKHLKFLLHIMKHRLLHPQLRLDGFVRFPADMHIVLDKSAVVKIGAKCEFDRGFTLSCKGYIEIGPRSFFGHHTTLAAQESIIIGADCQFAEMVSIRDHDHRSDRLDLPVKDQGMISKPVIIGDDVWIGSKATVLKGVTIGSHSIIGAGSVVTHAIPEYSIVAGIPAKIIRKRN